ETSQCCEGPTGYGIACDKSATCCGGICCEEHSCCIDDVCMIPGTISPKGETCTVADTPAGSCAPGLFECGPLCIAGSEETSQCCEGPTGYGIACDKTAKCCGGMCCDEFSCCIDDVCVIPGSLAPNGETCSVSETVAGTCAPGSFECGPLCIAGSEETNQCCLGPTGYGIACDKSATCCGGICCEEHSCCMDDLCVIPGTIGASGQNCSVADTPAGECAPGSFECGPLCLVGSE
ncbi:unnamed protein product, partial [Prorocentrum cordatum]